MLLLVCVVIFLLHPDVLVTYLNSDEEDSDAMYQWCAPPVDQLVQESGKLVFLVQLLQRLKSEGHRTLVFSQSRKMLDIIQKVLNDKVCFCSRILKENPSLFSCSQALFS